jgi:hypothetical protein
MEKTNVECKFCGVSFLKKNAEIIRCRKRNMDDFCSRSCVTKHRLSTLPKEYWKELYKKHPVLKSHAGNRQDEFSPFKPFIRKGRASLTKHKCTIDVVHLKQLWDDQHGVCPYTGIKMILPRNSTVAASECRSLKRASLDRIDSNKGYEPGNVEFVCFAINSAKNNFTKKEMSSFLTEVVSNRK